MRRPLFGACMDQSKIKVKNPPVEQFQYLGRWVDKKNFRAFVYNEKGDEKLADSYQEFESLTTSGLWFASKPSNKAPRLTVMLNTLNKELVKVADTAGGFAQ